MSNFIRPLFPLGGVKIEEPATVVMARAGQDADFFLQMHVCGIWSDEDAERNLRNLQTGSPILTRYRTLLGDEIMVFTFFDHCRTVVLCNQFESSTPPYEYTCAETSDDSGAPPDSGLSTADEEIASNSGSLGTMMLFQPTESNQAIAADYADNSPQCNFPIETNSMSDPFSEPTLPAGEYTISETGSSYLFDPGHDLWESTGYSPNMTYDAEKFKSDDASSTPDSTDKPPDNE